MRLFHVKSKAAEDVEINLVHRAPPTAIRTRLAKIVRPVSVYAVILACLFGGVFTFTSMVGVKFFTLPLLIVAFTVPVIMMLCLALIKKYYLVLIGAGVALTGFIAAFFGSTITGAMIVYDNTYAAIAKSMRWTAPDPLVKWDPTLRYDTTVFLCLAVGLLAVLLTFFIYYRINFIVALICTFPLFEIGAAFGCIPNSMFFALMVAGLIAVLAMQLSGRTRLKMKNKNGAKRSKRRIFDRKNTSNFAMSAVILAAVAFIIFSSVQTGLTDMGYDRPENLDNLRHTVKNAWSDFYDYITGEDHDGSLKEGRLTMMGDLKYKQRHYITVQMPNINEPVYLKGFVGTNYTGYSWEDTDLSEYKQLFDDLEQLNAYIPAGLGSMLNSSETNFQYASNNFYFKDFRRKKDYAYLTYGAYPVGQYSVDEDRYILTGDSTAYEYLSYLDRTTFEDVDETPLYRSKKYTKLREQYEKIIREKYTALPEMPERVTALTSKIKGNDYHKVDVVRNFLAANTEFSLYTKRFIGGGDFVDFFINEQKHGYTAHYATAAAVLLRMAGMPTRYVEGYYVSVEQVDQAKGEVIDTLKTVEITDMNAHAWIEIYLDRYGWMPVEVTPGFYSGSFEEQMNNMEQNDEEDEPEEVEPDHEEITDVVESDFNDADQVSDPDQPTEGTEVEQTIRNEGYLESNPAALIFIILGALILIALAVLLSRYFILKSRLEKSLCADDYDLRAENLYKYFIALLRFENIRPDNAASYREFAETVSRSRYFNEYEDTLVERFVRAAYSGEGMAEDELTSVNERIMKYRDEMYSQTDAKNVFVKIMNRLKMRFIAVLK